MSILKTVLLGIMSLSVILNSQTLHILFMLGENETAEHYTEILLQNE